MEPTAALLKSVYVRHTKCLTPAQDSTLHAVHWSSTLRLVYVFVPSNCTVYLRTLSITLTT
jgi:hypothetical protein